MNVGESEVYTDPGSKGVSHQWVGCTYWAIKSCRSWLWILSLGHSFELLLCIPAIAPGLEQDTASENLSFFWLLARRKNLIFKP